MISRQKVGTLKQDRCKHGVIFDGEKFLVIGGLTGSIGRHARNEICTLTKNKRMSCVEQSTVWKGSTDFLGEDYPELFFLGEDFGKDDNKC